MYESDILGVTREARAFIASLTDYEFAEAIPEDYKLLVIDMIRGIAVKALCMFTPDRLDKLFGGAAVEVSKLRDIIRITEPELVSGPDYEGTWNTISDIWCLATDEVVTSVPILHSKEGDFVVFSTGDGESLKCAKCNNRTHIIYVSVEEHDTMPYKKGENGALRYLLQHTEVGEALCDEHLYQLTTEVPLASTHIKKPDDEDGEEIPF